MQAAVSLGLKLHNESKFLKFAEKRWNDGRKRLQTLQNAMFEQDWTFWACDFTYVKVGGTFYYICAILDLYTRKVIACRVGRKIDPFLAVDTLQDAVRLRGVSKGVNFFVQYQSWRAPRK